jgi:predicted nucleic acid-binding Zn finger protein
MTIATTKPQVTQITRIKALRDRLIKAEELAREGKVHPVIDMPDHWVVEGTDRHYLVNNSCFCPDFLHRTHLLEGYCKHRLAALLYAEEHQQPEPSGKEELERNIADLYRSLGTEQGTATPLLSNTQDNGISQDRCGVCSMWYTSPEEQEAKREEE